MSQLFYAVARHSFMLRVLFALIVMVAIAIAIGAPEIAVAGPDARGP